MGEARVNEIETRTYSVRKLVELIKSGRVRILHFQRPYFWTDEDRRLLFDSIQQGFPIGSLVFGVGPAPHDVIHLGALVAIAPPQNEALWVVDGQQRLATLATALVADPMLLHRPLYFDLRGNRFELGERTRQAPIDYMPSQFLVDVRGRSRWLQEAYLGDEAVERADAIAAAIAEYEIAAYRVPIQGSEDEARLKAIFIRTNTAGRQLSPNEIFDALRSSRAGVKPLDHLQFVLRNTGFGAVDRALIEKCAIAAMGGDLNRPITEQTTTTEDRELQRLLVLGLVQAVGFLRTHLGVLHAALLPRPHALLPLVALFAKHPYLHPRNVDLLTRWFWRIAVSGRYEDPANVVRDVATLHGSEHEDVQALLQATPQAAISPEGYAIKPDTLVDSPGGRLALIALISLGPRLLTTGSDGSAIDVAFEFLKGSQQPEAVPTASLHEGGGKVAATFIHPQGGLTGLASIACDDPRLSSHAVSPAAQTALQQGATDRFVQLRAATIDQALGDFLTERLALNHPDRDRPPLASYLDPEDEDHDASP